MVLKKRYLNWRANATKPLRTECLIRSDLLDLVKIAQNSSKNSHLPTKPANKNFFSKLKIYQHVFVKKRIPFEGVKTTNSRKTSNIRSLALSSIRN